MPSQDLIEQNDESAPLLGETKQPNPLPKGQMFALLLLMTAEPLMGLSIIPYINELVTELPNTGGDEKKVGYYAGIIISFYFVGEASTVLQWGRLSDIIGCKPVILKGTLGLVVATTLFGLSRTLWVLAASRFLAGALNGNIGVMKSMLAEIADETNMAQAFAILPLSWAIGSTAGPYFGGVLSRPQDRWPNIFSHPFWKQYPYFLPCVATSVYRIASLIIASVFLKETLPKYSSLMSGQRDDPNLDRLPEIERHDECPNSFLGTQEEGQLEPPPRTLLTRPVQLTVANYSTFAFLEICIWVLLPLVYTTPIQLGGLGLDPKSMGVTLAVFGIMKGIVQLTVFDHIISLLGLRGTFITLLSCFVPSFLLFPIAGIRAQHAGRDIVVWVLVLIQLLCIAGIHMAYGCTFMYITTASPRGMLGATNGLTQTIGSIQRALGPAITASLFSFSLENNIMGGYAVFYALTLCTFGALWLASHLPPNGWKELE